MFDVTAPDFVETFSRHLRDEQALGQACYVPPSDPGEFELRDWLHSDTPILDESNMAHIRAALAGLAGYADDVITAVDADGVPTPAFVKLAELANELADYPILDGDDFSCRQCDAAGEYGLEYFGRETFDDWRAGELPDCAGWCGDPETAPAPDAQPEATCWQELTGEARDFIQGHAQSRFLDSEDAW